jgi:hypothetical protein
MERLILEAEEAGFSGEKIESMKNTLSMLIDHYGDEPLKTMTLERFQYITQQNEFNEDVDEYMNFFKEDATTYIINNLSFEFTDKLFDNIHMSVMDRLPPTNKLHSGFATQPEVILKLSKNNFKNRFNTFKKF